MAATADLRRICVQSAVDYYGGPEGPFPNGNEGQHMCSVAISRRWWDPLSLCEPALREHVHKCKLLNTRASLSSWLWPVLYCTCTVHVSGKAAAADLRRICVQSAIDYYGGPEGPFPSGNEWQRMCSAAISRH